MAATTNPSDSFKSPISGHEYCPVCASQNNSGSDATGRPVHIYIGKAPLQETITAVLSHPIESIDRRILNNVVKATALPEMPPLHRKTSQKIELIKNNILIPAAEAKLETIVQNAADLYHSTKSPFPSAHKLSSLVLAGLIDFYAENDHLFTLDQFLQKAGCLAKAVFDQEGLKCQMTPHLLLQELVKKTISPIFEQGHFSTPHTTSSFPSKVRMAQRLIQSLSSLSDKQQEFMRCELDKSLAAVCHHLQTHFAKHCPPDSSKIMRNLFAFSVLIKEFRSTAFLSQALQTETAELVNMLVLRFLTVFKHAHSKPIHQSAISTQAYLRQLMEQIVSLQKILLGNCMSSFLQEFESKLTAVINESFTPEVLASIAYSKNLSKTTKNLASSIRELTVFLDNEGKTLDSFVVCFDKIYVNLFGIRDTLANPDPYDLVNKTLKDILRGFISKAIHVFGKTEAAHSIDLGDEHNYKLKKRLDILMAVVPKLLHSHIQIKFSMNVSEDSLLATLYQLHATAYNDGDQTWQMIKEWISAHQDYDIKGFAHWLRNKITQNSPLVISEGDCEVTYSQFLSETGDETSGETD